MAHWEVLITAVRHLAELPVPTSLVLRVAGVEVPVVWTSSRERYTAAQAAGEVAFSPVEYEAVAGGVEAERAHAGDLLLWCARKLRDRAWRLSPRVALAGGRRLASGAVAGTWFAGGARVPAHRMAHGLTFGALLAQLGVDLVDVQLELGEQEAANA